MLSEGWELEDGKTQKEKTGTTEIVDNFIFLDSKAPETAGEIEEPSADIVDEEVPF